VSFIARRLAFYAVAAWVAITVNFAIPRVMPGNAVDAMLAKFPQLSSSSRQALQAEFGAGDHGSLLSQYVDAFGQQLRQEHDRNSAGRRTGELPTATGCRFAARCPLADDRCVAQSPPMRRIDAVRAAACWQLERSAPSPPSNAPGDEEEDRRMG
jgi:hypothetical protein